MGAGSKALSALIIVTTIIAIPVLLVNEGFQALLNQLVRYNAFVAVMVIIGVLAVIMGIEEWLRKR